MATRYRSDNDNLKAHIFTLRGVIVALFAVCLLLWISSENAKKVQRVYQPPDLRNGAVTQVNKVPATTVYAFALNIHQLLNTWSNDGATDYLENIHSYSAYFTPSFKEWLDYDAAKRKDRGELKGRVRLATPNNGTAFDERRVDITDNNNWVVWLDLDIKEYQKGVEIKVVTLRYPIKVVQVDISPELNPWGLQLNGFAGNPERLEKESKHP